MTEVGPMQPIGINTSQVLFILRSFLKTRLLMQWHLLHFQIPSINNRGLLLICIRAPLISRIRVDLATSRWVRGILAMITDQLKWTLNTEELLLI